jgi:hypothetical protein
VHVIDFSTSIIVYIFDGPSGESNIPRCHVLIERKLNKIAVDYLSLGLDKANAKHTDQGKRMDDTIRNILSILVAHEPNMNHMGTRNMMADWKGF